MSIQIRGCIAIGLLCVACEPEKEVVDVDPSILNPNANQLDVAGDWTMTSLDEEVYPTLASERYDQEGLTYKVYTGFGYGLEIADDGTAIMTSVDSYTLMVDDVIDENESYVLTETEAEGSISKEGDEYLMDLLFTDGETLMFTCTHPDVTKLSCTFIENEETKFAEFELGDVEKAVTDIPADPSEGEEGEGEDEGEGEGEGE